MLFVLLPDNIPEKIGVTALKMAYRGPNNGNNPRRPLGGAGPNAGAGPKRPAPYGANGARGGGGNTPPPVDESIPILENWEVLPDGRIKGAVYGRKGFTEGQEITTGAVVKRTATECTTNSGSR
jgi:hypothetical protein